MSAPASPTDQRCLCGRLLARLTDSGIELKCSRCRRVVVIAWSQVADERASSSEEGR